MNVFVQGMRRTGTTIVYDLLSVDPGFDVYYEPLAAGKQTLDLVAWPALAPPRSGPRGGLSTVFGVLGCPRAWPREQSSPSRP